MKTNNLHSIAIFCNSLAIATFLVIVSAMGTAKAQNTLPNVNQSTFNALFTPTAADRFFEVGREQMEREAEILANPERYYDANLLQIQTIDINMINELGETEPIPNFSEDSPQNHLK